MKSRLTPLVVVLSMSMVLMLGGCGYAGLSAQVQAPAYGGLVNQTQGSIYSDATAASSRDVRTGTAKAQSILGLVGTGNASIHAAASDADIDTITSVDQKHMQIIGIYGETTTVVRGY